MPPERLVLAHFSLLNLLPHSRLALPSPIPDDRGVKTRLKKLPAGKRRELDHVVAILRESFAEAVSTRRAERLKNGRILKIILFGSYARGDWVEDPVGRYFSDYDLLIVVDHEDLADHEFWEAAEQKLLSELSSGQHLRTPVSLIVHSLEDVDAQLSHGRYFFADIARDGLELFSEPGVELADTKPIDPERAQLEIQKIWNDRSITAGEFVDDGRSNFQRRRYKKAAFELHQATEQLYQAVLLVFTLYSPKSHNLVRLRKEAEALVPELAEAWPGETKFHKRCFELLRAAYVKARYSPHYRITEEELAWLMQRIEVLQDKVRIACEARLTAMAREAEASV